LPRHAASARCLPSDRRDLRSRSNVGQERLESAARLGARDRRRAAPLVSRPLFAIAAALAIPPAPRRRWCGRRCRARLPVRPSGEKQGRNCVPHDRTRRPRATRYRYRFRAGSVTSEVGRVFVTAPRTDDA
jgi:hypothetical protein